MRHTLTFEERGPEASVLWTVVAAHPLPVPRLGEFVTLQDGTSWIVHEVSWVFVAPEKEPAEIETVVLLR